MRFKIVALLVLLLFVPVLFSSVPAFSQDNTPSPDSLNQTIFSKTVTTKDTLVIAMSRDFRPFTFLNAEGQPAGLFVDIWKLWAERSGQTIEFRPSSWQETLDNLKHGHADIHAGLFYSDSRSHWMDFSQPFYGLDIEVFFPVKQGKISGLDELNDQEVGVVGGSHMKEYLRQQYPDIEVVTFRSNEDAARAVRDGKIGAFLAGFTETVALLDRLGWSGEFDSIDEALYTRKFHAGVLKGDQELLALVDQGFNRISNEELTEIESRWIPDPDHRYYHTRSKELRLTAAEEVWLREHRTLRVAMYFLPPFAMFEDDGSFHGIFGDYLDLISDRTGLQFNVFSSTSSEIPTLAKDRKVDMYPGPEIPGREAYLKYSDPFFSLSWGIINQINAPFVSRIRNLEGKTVALHKNTPIRQYITDHYPNIQLYLADDTVQALQAVSTNKADAFIGTLVPASYTIQKQRLTNLKIAAPVEYPDLLMKYAIRNDWPELFTIVNKAIASITPQEHDDIVRNWISIQYEHTVNWTVVWRWIGLIAAVSGALLTLTLFWNRRLAKEINERKHAETALAKVRDELEIRVQERTAELAQTNESLQESTASYRELADSITDVFFAMDANLRYTYWNKASTALTGIPPEDALRKSLYDLFPDTPETRKAEEVYRDVLRTQQPRSFVNEYRLSDRTFFFEISVYPSRHGISVFTRDITDRNLAEKAIQESEERLRKLFETMIEGVILIDSSGQIVQANPAAESILGLKRSEIEGRNYVSPEWKIVRSDGTPMPPEEMAGPRAMQEKQPVKNVLMGVERSDGAISWINVNATPLMNEVGKPEGVVGTFADITDRKQAEEELKKYREHLEDLVQKRTHELEARTKELETFNKAMVDREMRIIEMKEEVNRLCEELGREPKYPPVWQ